MSHHRSGASIVVVASETWTETRACLDAVRLTLAPIDEVIVVDDGTRDPTATRLAARPWLRVITNDTVRGTTVARTQGARAARNDVVVFVDVQATLTRWSLDALLAPFADPAVVASGPHSNHVASTPPVGVTRSGAVSAAARLDHACIAVRRTAVAGLTANEDLSAALARHGRRLVIAHDAYVHVRPPAASVLAAAS